MLGIITKPVFNECNQTDWSFFFGFVQAELTTCSVGHAEAPLAGPRCLNRPENHFGAVFPVVKVALLCLMLCLIPLRPRVKVLFRVIWFKRRYGKQFYENKTTTELIERRKMKVYMFLKKIATLTSRVIDVNLRSSALSRLTTETAGKHTGQFCFLSKDCRSNKRATLGSVLVQHYHSSLNWKKKTGWKAMLRSLDKQANVC